MKSPARLAFVVSVLAAIVLVACGTPAPATSMAYAATAAPAYDEMQAAPASAAASAPSALFDVNAAPQAGGVAVQNVPGAAPAATPAATTGGPTLPDSNAPQSGRMIIKNAELKLQVADTDTGIDRTTQVVGDVGGYIISSRVWYQEDNGTNYKYATISMGVPVDQFETAMRRLRDLSLKVLDENASGQDVSNQYVDLQSQLANLQATRDRIRSFLDQAKTVDEALQVNQQLTSVEGQIEQVQGQMNYLSGRSAFSTITVNLEPKIPEASPTPTATPTATPTPDVWTPGTTVAAAEGTLGSTYQVIFEILIWVFLWLIPVLAPPALIIWGIWKLLTRKNKRAVSG